MSIVSVLGSISRTTTPGPAIRLTVVLAAIDDYLSKRGAPEPPPELSESGEPPASQVSDVVWLISQCDAAAMVWSNGTVNA